MTKQKSASWEEEFKKAVAHENALKDFSLRTSEQYLETMYEIDEEKVFNFIKKLIEEERRRAKIEVLLKVSKPATQSGEPLGVGLKVLTNINEELNNLQK